MSKKKAKDIYEQLKMEHDEVKKLLSKVDQAPATERMTLFHQLKEELIPHTRGEEKTIYALLYERAQAQNRKAILESTNESYEEHRALDSMLADLGGVDVSHETWLGKFMKVKETLEHHISKEEEELFPLAKEVIDSKEQEELFAAYRSARDGFLDWMPSQDQISERTPSDKTQRI